MSGSVDTAALERLEIFRVSDRQREVEDMARRMFDGSERMVRCE